MSSLGGRPQQGGQQGPRQDTLLDPPFCWAPAPASPWWPRLQSCSLATDVTLLPEVQTPLPSCLQRSPAGRENTSLHALAASEGPVDDLPTSPPAALALQTVFRGPDAHRAPPLATLGDARSLPHPLTLHPAESPPRLSQGSRLWSLQHHPSSGACHEPGAVTGPP